MSRQTFPAAYNAGLQYENHALDDQEPSENLPDEQPACSPPITDEQAEQMLPGYALAFETYHQRRNQGMIPEDALMETLAEWRKLWSATAYVPHRNR